MTNREKREKMIEMLESLEHSKDWELTQAWNEMCECYRYDDYIYDMPFLSELFIGASALDIFEKLDESFTRDDQYFWWDEIRQVYKSGDLNDSPYDAGMLADYILDEDIETRHYRGYALDWRQWIEDEDEEN